MNINEVFKLMRKHSGKYVEVARELGTSKQRVHKYCQDNGIVVLKTIVKLPIDE